MSNIISSPPFTPKIANREESRSITAFRPRLLYSTTVSSVVGSMLHLRPACISSDVISPPFSGAELTPCQVFMECIDMRRVHCPNVGTIVAQIYRERHWIYLLTTLRNRSFYSWIWGIFGRCPREKIFLVGMGEVESVGSGFVHWNLGIFWTLLAGIHA